MTDRANSQILAVVPVVDHWKLLSDAPFGIPVELLLTAAVLSETSVAANSVCTNSIHDNHFVV